MRLLEARNYLMAIIQIDTQKDKTNKLPSSYFDQKIAEFKLHGVLFHKNLDKNFDYEDFKK